MFLWIKKPGIAGDGKREQVAFHDRKLGYLPVGEPICRDIAKQRRAEKADTVSVTTQPGCNLSGLRCDGDGAAAAIWRLCPGLWRYIRGALSGTGSHRGSGTGREGGNICFCAVDAVHISRIYMRRIYVSPAHRLIFLRCQSCVE